MTVQDGDPGTTNLLFNVWLYPMSLSATRSRTRYDFPEEAYREPEGLWMEMPRCLKTYRTEYRVRKTMEDVDGFPCHVIEWAKKDIIWIDHEHGFNVRRAGEASNRPAISPSTSRPPAFKERAPGVWVPDRQISVAFNMDRSPQGIPCGRVSFIMINALREVAVQPRARQPLRGAALAPTRTLQIHDSRKPANN